MSDSGNSSKKPAALKADIRTVEHRLEQRQARLGIAFANFTANLRARLVAPTTIIAAALFGVALHRSHRLRDFRVLAALQTLNAGLRYYSKVPFTEAR